MINFQKDKKLIADKVKAGSLIELLLAVELGLEERVNFDFYREPLNKDDSKMIQSSSLRVKTGDELIGMITCNLNAKLEESVKPMINIGVINGCDTPRMGNYLLTSLLLYNAAYNPLTSEIQPYGFNFRRCGDREQINKEFAKVVDGVKTFGGRPSQLLHLNYGFKFDFADFNNELFTVMDSLDASADLESDCNEDDSLLTKILVTCFCNWSSERSLPVYDVISEAYHLLINQLWTLSGYQSIGVDYEPVNELSKQVINQSKSLLKKNFLKNYELIYNNALTKFKSFRRKLKRELLNDLSILYSGYRKQLLSLINPLEFDDDLYSKFVTNFLNSRGVAEVKYLIDDFDPERATIPLPCPKKVKENFNLMVNYFTKYTLKD